MLHSASSSASKHFVETGEALVVPDASDRERIAILEDGRKIYERDYLPSVKPFEGAREVIKILAEQGGRIALATDCKGLSFTRHMLLLDSRDYIAATACGDDLALNILDGTVIGRNKVGVSRTKTFSFGKIFGRFSRSQTNRRMKYLARLMI